MLKFKKYKGRVLKQKGKTYLYCSYFKAYFPERFFYKNAHMISGYQNECKIVSKFRASTRTISQIINELPAKERKIFV